MNNKWYIYFINKDSKDELIIESNLTHKMAIKKLKLYSILMSWINNKDGYYKINYQQ